MGIVRQPLDLGLHRLDMVEDGLEVGLVGASGVAAELTLRYPLRVWLIPRLWRVKATRVTLSVRNPHKMVERFGPVKAEAARGGGSKKKRR